MNESHVVNYGSEETVTVTPFDANHCPGSAMFLFEGQFGRILYTGDFRYSGPMLNDIKLHSLCTANIDVLYLDNTFCDPRCIFPSREDAIVEILRIVRTYPDAQVKIGLRHLGKEQMLVVLARSLSEHIGVSEERYHILETLCMPNVFSVSPSCRIQVVPLYCITTDQMAAWNQEQQTIAVIPTGIATALGYRSFPQRDDVYVVPYSDHSSYEELQQFVSAIEPRKIYPILGPDAKDRLFRSLPKRADMSCFQINGGDIDQVTAADGNDAVVTCEQANSASTSSSTNVNDSSVINTQSKTRKMRKSKGGFCFKKKVQMGVVFSCSQSPVKHPEDVTKQSVVADAVCVTGIVDVQSVAQSEAGAAPALNTVTDPVCDTATERNEERNEEEDRQQQPLQCNSHHTSDDKRTMTIDIAENDPVSSISRVNSIVGIESEDRAWMLQVLQPLISEEAHKIMLERQSFSGPFCKSLSLS